MNIKYLKNYTSKKIKDYSPNYILKSKKMELAKEILKEIKNKNNATDRKYNNKDPSKLNLKGINNFSKIKLNLIKNKDFIKKKILKKKDNSNEKKNNKNDKLFKTNNKILESKSKFYISEYLLSFITKIKTESDIFKKKKNEKENKKLFFKYIQHDIHSNKGQSSRDKLLTSISRTKEKVKKKFSRQIKQLISKNTKNIIKNSHRKASSNYESSIMKTSYYNISNINYSKGNNKIVNYSSINNKNILLSSFRKKEISTQREKGFFKHKKLFLKINSYKQNHLINSPFNSFNTQPNENKIIKNNRFFNLNKKTHSINQKTNPYKFRKIKKYDIKNENKKSPIYKKNLKKSCDLNQEREKKCKNNILNKINSTNDTNNLYKSDLDNSNIVEFKQKFNEKNCLLNSENLKRINKNGVIQLSGNEQKNENDKSKIFKKIMAIKIKNYIKRKDRRIIQDNIIKKDKDLPLSIKVNSSNFLSKFKGK